MKFGLVVILTLALGSLAAHFLLEDNGYVLVNFRGYAVEMSVPVLLFLAFLSYLTIRLIVRIWNAPRRLGEAVEEKIHQRAARQASRGMIALAEGRLAKGERLLTRSARRTGTPLLQYLAAARTAHMQGDRERRDGWLKMAYDQDADAANAVLLTQAELQLSDGEYEQARASLARVCDSQPNHPVARKMVAELHEIEEDWAALHAMLPELRRLKTVGRRQLQQWTVDSVTGLLGNPAIERDRIDELWKSLPRATRKEAAMIRARISALVAAGDSASAESEIRKALRSAWDPALVVLYGELDPADKSAQLRQVENWLNDRPEDPDLLLTAGRSCKRNELWGKARSYLESSLAIRPTAAAYHELGQLMLQIGEDHSATEAFQKGLTMISGATDAPRLEIKSD